MIELVSKELTVTHSFREFFGYERDPAAKTIYVNIKNITFPMIEKNTYCNDALNQKPLSHRFDNFNGR